MTGFRLDNNVVEADFYYKKNAQNDIIGIYSTSGDEIARYEYDAWGNCVAKYLQDDGTYAIINNDYSYNDTTVINRFIAFKNPFRYRSYYYDFETNLYYLNSRYYDPKIGRFLNADDISTLDVTQIALNGLNLYAYCLNDPINETDENGYFLLWLFITAILVGAVIGGTTNGIKAYNEGARGWGLFGAILGGAIMGGAMGAITVIGGAAGMASIGMVSFISTGTALGISVGIGIVAGIASYSVEYLLRDDLQFTWEGFFMAGLSGGLKGLTTFGVAFYGGKFGAFDKAFLKQILGKEIVRDIYSYGLAKSLLSGILPSLGRTIFTNISFYLGDFLTKLLLVNSISSGIRWIIDKIFNK